MKQLLTGYTVNNSLGKSGLFGIMGSFVKIDKNNEPVKTYHNWEVGSNVEHRFVKSISAVLDTIIAHNAQQAPTGKSVASINIIDEVVVVDVETYMEDGRKLYSSVISLDGVVINEFPGLCKKIISCDEGIRNCYWQVWAPEGYRHWTNSNGIHQITCEKTLAALNKAHVELTGVSIEQAGLGGLNHVVASIIAAETPIDKSKLTGVSPGDVLVGFSGNDQTNAEVLGVYACNSEGIKQMADDLLRHDASKAESRSAAASLLSPTGFESQGGINSSAERCSMVGKSTASKADFAAGIRSLDPSKVSFMVTQFETPKVCYDDVSDDEDDTVVKYISRPVLLDEESGECVVVSEEDWLTGNVEANLFSVYAVCDSGEHVCVADFDTKDAADAVARTLNQLHRL